MTVGEIADIINFVEGKYEVDKWSIDGVPLWPFIRLQNYSLLSYKALNAPPVNTRSFTYAKKILKFKIDRTHVELKRLEKQGSDLESDVFFLGEGIFYVELSGQWYHKFTDPIISAFKKVGLRSCRFDLSHKLLFPKYFPSRQIQHKVDNIIISSILLSKLIGPAIGEETWVDYDKFFEDENIRSKLPFVPSKEELRRRIVKIKRIEKFYIKLLKRVQPKLAFTVNYYGDDQMAFILACRTLNIPSVDIQHGVQGSLHLAYGRWEKVPATGYSQLPDYFLVWSTAEAKAIDVWSSKICTHKAVISGNFFADMWKVDHDELTSTFDDRIKAAKLYPEKPIILLTLSPYTDSLMEETWAAIKETQHIYNWFIRLHPSMGVLLPEFKSRLREIGILNFQIELPSELPLNALFRLVNTHITCQSSCVIEAAEFGIRSIITSTYGKELYANEIAAGFSVVRLTRNEIIEELKESANNVKPDFERGKSGPELSIADLFKKILKVHDSPL